MLVISNTNVGVIEESCVYNGTIPLIRDYGGLYVIDWSNLDNSQLIESAEPETLLIYLSAYSDIDKLQYVVEEYLPGFEGTIVLEAEDYSSVGLIQLKMILNHINPPDKSFARNTLYITIDDTNIYRDKNIEFFNRNFAMFGECGLRIKCLEQSVDVNAWSWLKQIPHSMTQFVVLDFDLSITNPVSMDTIITNVEMMVPNSQIVVSLKDKLLKANKKEWSNWFQYARDVYYVVTDKQAAIACGILTCKKQYINLVSVPSCDWDLTLSLTIGPTYVRASTSDKALYELSDNDLNKPLAELWCIVKGLSTI